MIINQTIYKIKKGANLSRVKEIDGKLFSDNIKAPKTLTLYNKHLSEDFYDEQIDEEFFEFKTKNYGKFIVHALDITIIERKI
ncbi:MAG TPA: hypothetical protein DHV22_16505 [Xanthomarina gelatinilytica]|uniref:Uncharacterized protein n=1 Tax=Xanthomarina gelatinilytica TaxID=1137281 RepID=A0A3D6BV21_9FLAO|nr:hypothetical protein [Xanthomarina gelatinilytica]|tara:strand:+ start:1289 stop:1537 length:249 start_codon:yes stop_codon:yes gene_type:complete